MGPPATILFLGANPSSTTRLTLDREAREIGKRLRSAEHRDAFRIEQAWAVRASDLQECLLRFAPTIVHFGGHGGNTGALLLESPEGDAVPVTAAALAQLFGILRGQTKCVFLNACFSERQALAITEHVDCVIGMTNTFGDESAIAFAGAFYQGIGFGRDVQTAFDLGRNRLNLTGLPDTDVPKLLVRPGVDASSLRLAGAASAARSPAPPEQPDSKQKKPRRRAAPPLPQYRDEETRLLSEQLAKARARKKELEAQKLGTAGVNEEIQNLRLRIREGGQLRAGDSLLDGRYLLVNRLGSGGFATVWNAYDTEAERRVAIKVLHADVAADPLKRERFFRGASAMMSLEHEFVVRVLTPRGEDGGYYFFVMDFIKGGDLDKAVAAGRITREGAISVILNIGKALAIAHSKGLVHRDVKPANILLLESGEPRLTDFDLLHDPDRTHMTRTGPMGTWAYGPPELFDQSNKLTPAADVFSLGMTLMFCLRREKPLKGGSYPPTTVVDELAESEELKAVLRKAIDHDPAARFKDAAEFCDALSSARDLRPHHHRALRAPSSKGGSRRSSAGHVLSGRRISIATLVLAVPGTAVYAWTGTGLQGWLKTIHGDATQNGGEETGILPAAQPSSAGAGPNRSHGGAVDASDAALQDVSPVAPSPSAPASASALAAKTSSVDAEPNESHGGAGDASDAAPPDVPLASSASAPPSVSALSANLAASQSEERACPGDMKLIRPGVFIMGSNSKEDGRIPEQRVVMKSFCMDETEVTVAAYTRCIEANGCTEPASSSPADLCVTHKGYMVPEGESIGGHPITCVTWDQANKYCEWAGKRLPDEEEWEYAARGAEGRIYPWGNNLDRELSLVNACDKSCLDYYGKGPTTRKKEFPDDGSPVTAKVGSYSNGASTSGILDMAGNVSEWVNAMYCSGKGRRCVGDDTDRVVRGGSWRSEKAALLQSTSREKVARHVARNFIGFRCAKSLK